MNNQIKDGNTKKLLTPKLIAVLGVVLMILSLIIPYTTATDKYMDRVELFEDELEEATGMDADDMENMSMLEFLSFFKYVARDDKSMTGFDVFLLIIVALIGGFSLLTMIFVVNKKTAGIIIFDIFAFLGFCVENWVYTAMDIVPDSYSWSAGYYLFFAATIIVFVGAILIARENTKQKKMQQAAAAQQYYQSNPGYYQPYANTHTPDVQQNQSNSNGTWQR